jgi:hypothetical protein
LLVIHKLKFLLFLCWVWFWIQKRVEFVMVAASLNGSGT